MVRGEKRRSVSFNLDSPEERALYEHSMQVNFSQLVKKYLTRELKRQLQQAEQSSLQVKLGDEK